MVRLGTVEAGSVWRRVGAVALAGVLALLNSAARADEPVLSSGQTVYVPVYSQVLFGDRSGSILVRASVFVRNTDPNHAITVVSSEYRDSKGKLLKNFVAEPVRVAPLATVHFDIAESDTSGRTAPSMLVRWTADRPVNEPAMHALMISAFEGQGISFLTEGQPIDTGTK
ncbi:MAG: DUF3124 domain-containing protein [Myxococcota bacterium]|nr:DUF3124 domain-containing protein [Myxococcota bacterium]